MKTLWNVYDSETGSYHWINLQFGTPGDQPLTYELSLWNKTGYQLDEITWLLTFDICIWENLGVNILLDKNVL